MTKSPQDIDRKDDQQKSEIRAILKRHSLTFSEQGVRSVLKVIERFQSTLVGPRRLTKSQIRTEIKALKKTARLLSEQLRKLSSYIALEDPPDVLQFKLNHLVLCCEQSLTHSNSKKTQKEGRPFTTLPLKLLIQRLILIFEKETGISYVIEESSPGGRERTAYSTQVHEYVKSILEYVAPDQDAQEAMKAARRPPVPLEFVRKMQNNIDEYFSKNPDNFF